MAQQINLLNPALLPRREVLNLRLMTVVLVVAMVGMLVLYGYESYQVSTLARQAAMVAAQLDQIKQSMLEASRRYAPREPSAALAQQVAAMEAKLQSHENVLTALKNYPPTQTIGFSPYLRAFARQGIKGLWLTGLSIDAAGSGMTIRGRALMPELVPRYIAVLGSEPTLKGQKFSTMQMILPQRDATAPDAKAKPELQYVEFTLQSTTDGEGKRS